MTKHTVIETPAGERLVLIPLADYEDMIARLEDAEEDAADVAEFDAAMAQADLAKVRQVPPDELRGSYLRFRRKGLGMTQSGLSTATGLAQGYISDLEAGRKTPSLDALLKLARALGIEGDELSSLREGYGLPGTVEQEDFSNAVLKARDALKG